MEAWRSSYTVEVWKGSYIVKAWTIVLIRCWVSSTIMTPRTREEKFLHRRSVERDVHCGSIEDCANPLLGIKHHNDSYAVEAWWCYLWEGWCMCDEQCLWLGLTCIVIEENHLWEGCWSMWEAMPLNRVYMHNSRKLPLKGLQQETMPLDRTYMYNSR